MYFASKHAGSGSCQNSTVSCPREFVQLAPMRKREKRCSTQEYHLFQFDISIRILIIPVLFSNSYKSTSPFSTQPDPIPSNTTSGSCGAPEVSASQPSGKPLFLCSETIHVLAAILRPRCVAYVLLHLGWWCWHKGDSQVPNQESFSPWLAQTLVERNGTIMHYPCLNCLNSYGLTIYLFLGYAFSFLINTYVNVKY